MNQLHVDILGINEQKWTGIGDFKLDDHTVFYSRLENQRKNSTVFRLMKDIANIAFVFNEVNNQIISVRPPGQLFIMTVIQVYVAITDAEEEENDMVKSNL